MMILINKNLLITLFLSISFIGRSQNSEMALSKKELRKERATFLGISGGLSSSRFRDFATSPLVYKGNEFYAALARFKADSTRESEMELSTLYGSYYTNFNNHFASSNVHTLSVFYSQLYQLKFLSSKRFNYKLGGLFNTTGNLRDNEILMNNGFGFEVFPTLFGSAKITINLNRTAVIEKKLLFIKYKLKPVNRNLAFRLNTGILNSTFRNKFIYTGHFIATDLGFFDRYEYKFLSGFRFNFSIDYTVFLKNKNAVKLSYLWDAYRTGGNLDKFEMAHHIIKLSLLFNTNNKPL